MKIKFIEVYFEKINKKAEFIKIKEIELKNKIENLKTIKEEIEKAKINQMLNMCNDNFEKLKSIEKQKDILEKDIENDRENIKKLNSDFNFVYDPKEIIKEINELYKSTGIESDFNNSIELKEEIKVLDKRIKSKVYELNQFLQQLEFRFDKLYIDAEEKTKLSADVQKIIGEIDFKLRTL